MQKEFKNLQYYKFCMYGFFKNLQLFEPFLLLFFLEKEMSYLQIGILYSAREIGAFILEIPSGFFADILGRRKIMILSFTLYIISFLLFFFSLNFAMLIMAMLVFSIGKAFRSGTHKAMIFDYLITQNWQQQKLIYYGHTRSWSQIGSSISSLLAAAMVFYYKTYQVIFIFSTIPYLINLLLIWSYPKVLDGPIKIKDNKTLKERLSWHFLALKKSLNQNQIWVIFINLATFQAFFKSLKDYLQPIIIIISTTLLSRFNVNANQAIIVGIVYFIIYLISSFTSRNSSYIVSNLKSEKRALAITLILGLAAGTLAGLVLNNQLKWIAILPFVIIYILQNIQKPVGATLISKHVKKETYSTSLSIQAQIESLFTAVLAFGIGALANFLELYQAIAIFAGIILFLTIFIYIIVLFTPNK